jgi:hypothetical protein
VRRQSIQTVRIVSPEPFLTDRDGSKRSVAAESPGAVDDQLV